MPKIYLKKTDEGELTADSQALQEKGRFFLGKDFKQKLY